MAVIGLAIGHHYTNIYTNCMCQRHTINFVVYLMFYWFVSEEAESLGVQELPRSSSSLSLRTDASGHGEHASSDSFYDSDNTEAEASPAPQTVTKQASQSGGNFKTIFNEKKKINSEKPNQHFCNCSDCQFMLRKNCSYCFCFACDLQLPHHQQSMKMMTAP